MQNKYEMKFFPLLQFLGKKKSKCRHRITYMLLLVYMVFNVSMNQYANPNLASDMYASLSFTTTILHLVILLTFSSL